MKTSKINIKLRNVICWIISADHLLNRQFRGDECYTIGMEISSTDTKFASLSLFLN